MAGTDTTYREIPHLYSLFGCTPILCDHGMNPERPGILARPIPPKGESRFLHGQVVRSFAIRSLEKRTCMGPVTGYPEGRFVQSPKQGAGIPPPEAKSTWIRRGNLRPKERGNPEKAGNDPGFPCSDH